MSLLPTILYPTDGAWQVLAPDSDASLSVPVGDESTPAQAAGAVALLLKNHGYRGDGVLLALPAGWCLAAGVSTQGLPADDRGALAFKLEEQLPIPAEAFTADFSETASLAGPVALGVAVANDRLTPIIRALESAGVSVQSVTAAGALALDACMPRIASLLSPAKRSMNGHAGAPAATALVLLPDSPVFDPQFAGGGLLNLFAVAGDAPVAWITPAANPDELRQAVDFLRLENPGDAPLLTCGLPALDIDSRDVSESNQATQANSSAGELPADPFETLADEHGLEFEESPATPPARPTSALAAAPMRAQSQLAVRRASIANHPAVTSHDLLPLIRAHAAAILSGRKAAMFEFRRGVLAAGDPLRLYRRAINATCAVVAACLLIVAGVLIYRGQQYDRIAAEQESQLAAEFRAHFPGWQVPFNVRAVVQGELRKLTAQGSSALPAETRESALRLMREVLTGLSADSPIAIDRMAVNDTSLELEGRCRSSEDLNPLIAAARAAGLDVPLPQTRKSADGSWSFTLRGSKPLKAVNVGAGG